MIRCNLVERKRLAAPDRHRRSRLCARRDIRGPCANARCITGGQDRVAVDAIPATGIFYEAWHGSGNWERYEVPSRDCPRISAAWLEERRREDPLKFAREYECSWSAGADCLLSDELLDRITRDDYELFPAFRRRADDDQDALCRLLEPGLQMDAVGPAVDVALCRQIALLPPRMLLGP